VGNGKAALTYLAPYVFKVAIGESRIVCVKVRERDDYKKEAKENKAKVKEAEKSKKNQHGVR